jgi:hypothetical protein
MRKRGHDLPPWVWEFCSIAIENLILAFCWCFSHVWMFLESPPSFRQAIWFSQLWLLCNDFSPVLLWSPDLVLISVFVSVFRLAQQGFVPPDLCCLSGCCLRRQVSRSQLWFPLLVFSSDISRWASSFRPTFSQPVRISVTPARRRSSESHTGSWNKKTGTKDKDFLGLSFSKNYSSDLVWTRVGWVRESKLAKPVFFTNLKYDESKLMKAAKNTRTKFRVRMHILLLVNSEWLAQTNSKSSQERKYIWVFTNPLFLLLATYAMQRYIYVPDSRYILTELKIPPKYSASVLKGIKVWPYEITHWSFLIICTRM